MCVRFFFHTSIFLFRWVYRLLRKFFKHDSHISMHSFWGVIQVEIGALFSWIVKIVIAMIAIKLNCVCFSIDLHPINKIKYFNSLKKNLLFIQGYLWCTSDRKYYVKAGKLIQSNSHDKLCHILRTNINYTKCKCKTGFYLTLINPQYKIYFNFYFIRSVNNNYVSIISHLNNTKKKSCCAHVSDRGRRKKREKQKNYQKCDWFDSISCPLENLLSRFFFVSLLLFFSNAFLIVVQVATIAKSYAINLLLLYILFYLMISNKHTSYGRKCRCNEIFMKGTWC